MSWIIEGYKVDTCEHGWSYVKTYVCVKKSWLGLIPYWSEVYSTEGKKGGMMTGYEFGSMMPDEVYDYYVGVVRDYKEYTFQYNNSLKRLNEKLTNQQ